MNTVNLKKIIILVVLAGSLLLAWGMMFKTNEMLLKRNKNTNINQLSKLDYIIKKLRIKTLLVLLARNKAAWINRLELRALEFSEVSIGLEQLYFLKILSFVLVCAVVSVVSYTNIEYQARLIIGYSGQKTSITLEKGIYQEPNYRLYEHILNRVGEEVLKEATEAERYHIVESEMKKIVGTDNKQLAEERSKWFLSKWEQIHRLKVYRYYHTLIILSAFFIPEVVLIIRGVLRLSIYKREVVKLEYIFELLARVEGVNTFEIIKELQKASKVYSKCLNEFLLIFRYDKIKGFEFLKSRNISSLTKIAEVIEVYSLSNKEIAMQILERQAMERDESALITAEESVDLVDLIAFLSIVPMVYEMARLMLNPMLDIVYKAFEFI